MENLESQENSVESTESTESMEELNVSVDNQRAYYETLEGEQRENARILDAITIAAEMAAEEE